MSNLTHSPPFRVLHTDVIAAGASVLIRAAGMDTNNADAKYAPFNNLFVQNFDSEAIDVEYGLGRHIRVPGGMSMAIEQPGIDQIRLTNMGVSATSKPIEVIYQLQPTTNNLLYALLTGVPLVQAMRK